MDGLPDLYIIEAIVCICFRPEFYIDVSVVRMLRYSQLCSIEGKRKSQKALNFFFLFLGKHRKEVYSCAVHIDGVS